jgi:ABC-type lipoprotein export system ATPase subunit
VDKANLGPLFNLLRGLSDEMGVQFIMVTHMDDEAVTDLADRIIRLDHRREDNLIDDL